METVLPSYIFPNVFSAICLPHGQNELREVVSARWQNKTAQILSTPHPPDPETRIQQHVEQFPLWETS